MPGFSSGSYVDLRARVGHGALDLLPDDVGRIEHEDGAALHARDLDIFTAGSWRFITRPPVSGKTPSGTANVSPYRVLKRCAMSRESSRCWRWSSPIGTQSAW